MKAITNERDLPKFLIVNDVPEKQSYNKYLLKPWAKGELVKVAPIEEQVSSPFAGTPTEQFRKRYVKVIRKDDNGKWTLVYTADWKYFELLKNKKK